MSDEQPYSDSYPRHTEHFEVVMLRDGVGDDAATQDDLKRVAVMATDPLAALMTDEVLAVAKTDGFRAIFASKPGVPTGPEIMARRRALEASSRNDGPNGRG
jgi:hypothetical protein